MTAVSIGLAPGGDCAWTMVNAALDAITLIDRNYTYRIVTDA